MSFNVVGDVDFVLKKILHILDQSHLVDFEILSESPHSLAVVYFTGHRVFSVRCFIYLTQQNTDTIIHIHRNSNDCMKFTEFLQFLQKQIRCIQTIEDKQPPIVAPKWTLQTIQPLIDMTLSKHTDVVLEGAPHLTYAFLNPNNRYILTPQLLNRIIQHCITNVDSEIIRQGLYILKLFLNDQRYNSTINQCTIIKFKKIVIHKQDVLFNEMQRHIVICNKLLGCE
jgi:hypothetical protein